MLFIRTKSTGQFVPNWVCERSFPKSPSKAFVWKPITGLPPYPQPKTLEHVVLVNFEVLVLARSNWQGTSGHR